MKNIFSIGILVFFLCPFCHSQESNNKHKIYIEIGYAGGTNFQGGAGGVFGAAGFYFKTGGRMSSIDARSKELYLSSPQRIVGALSLTYRLFITKAFYAGLGFAYNRETPFADYLNDAATATFGGTKSLVRRYGVCADAGINLGSLVKKGWIGIYPMFNLNVAYFPIDKEPNPFVTLTAGFRFGLKRLPEVDQNGPYPAKPAK